jgi:hypothetical protein
VSALWTIVDSRTGQPVTISSYPSQASAERQIAAWRQRDARGGRPDIHESMPYLMAQQQRAEGASHG